MTDDELLRRFEDCTLDSFPHRDHLRVAWLYLRRNPFLTAAAAFVAGLRRFATAAGKPELYHETITWAFLVIIRERMHGREDQQWDAFAAENRDLLSWKPSVLDRYYSTETLFSERARTVFLMPDRVSVE